MRLSVAVAAVCLSIIGLASADDVRAAIRKPTNIPAQSLGTALQQLAKDRNFQIVYVTEEVNSLRTGGAVGEFNTEEALKILLKGTGLTYRYLDEKTVTILPSSGPSGSGGSTPTPSSGQPTSSSSGNDGRPGQDSTAQRFLVAQANVGQAGNSPAPAIEEEKRRQGTSEVLQEVIVTAQKREERLQDVPVPVTAIRADTLLDTNQLRILDYYTSVPGLSVTPDDLYGSARVTIRGITTGGFSNPTVGIVVDDVPYGSSAGIGIGWVAPDLDPSELQRIEVLRGPQGTLYGASSMGGLIKYVTVDPSTEGVSGRLQADGDDVKNGSGVGYGIRGSVNVPITDTLAVRVGGFARQEPGYIDDPALNINGVNKTNAEGGRIAALWRPSETLSLKLSALYQESRADGLTFVDPSLGDLQQDLARGINGNGSSGGFDVQIQAYSATLNAKLGSADLTAITGYNVNRGTYKFDISPLLTGFVNSFFNVNDGGAPQIQTKDTTKFTQEIRLSVPLSGRVEWLIGGFYDHEYSPISLYMPATIFLTGQPIGLLLQYPPTPYGGGNRVSEYAGFTDLTYHFTDRFDVQLGGRESHIEVDNLAQAPFSGIFAGTPTFVPAVDSSANAFTYLATPEYKISPDLMVYARFASGYRPGGPNPYVSPQSPIYDPNVPTAFAPDKTYTYELGTKGEFLDHTLSIDADVYYIDWRNIQLTLVGKLSTYGANGGQAKSEGVEFSVESRPVQSLTISAWIAFDDAVLTESFPAASTAYGVDGDRLPNSSRFTGTLSFEQRFALTSGASGFVGGSTSYISDSVGQFTGTALRQTYPAYGRTDLRVGVRSNSWTGTVFVNNVADKRAALTGGIGSEFPSFFQYIQPRTIGLSVSKSF